MIAIRVSVLILAATAAVATAAAAAASPPSSVEEARSVRQILRPMFDGRTIRDGAEICEVRAFRCARDLAQAGRTQAALPLFQRDAREGSAVAMRAIGLIYLHGEGDVAQDSEQAMSWFYEAALHDDAESMFILAAAFRRGIGVEPDEALSRFWLRRAAENGSRRARRELASLR